MDPSHPDFFQRADPLPDRIIHRRGRRDRVTNRTSEQLRWLLPLAAAVPLVIAVIQHRPSPKMSSVESRNSASLPALQDELVSQVGTTAKGAASESSGQGQRGRLTPRSHVVEAGETLGGIARDYRCDLKALAAANGIDPEGQLLAGTVLLLPRPGVVSKPEPAAVAVAAPPPVVPQGPDVVLTPVAPDWTPPAPSVSEEGASSAGTQVRSAIYPSVAPEPVVAGEIPVRGVIQPVSGRTIAMASAAAKGAAIHYLVQEGDKWESVAAAHFTTVAVLQHVNGPIPLTPGQVIQVPVEQCLTQGR
jgi:LysM repeat protein